MRKIVQDENYNNSTMDKGLIMVKLNVKKPMIINFMNK